MTPESTNTQATNLDLREVVGLFRHHWGKLFLCVAVAVGLMAFYLQRARPVFTSSALLEVGEHRTRTSDADTLDELKTVELKIASQPVLLGVVTKHHLAERPEYRGDAGFHTGLEAIDRAGDTAMAWLRRMKVDRLFGGIADLGSDGEQISDAEVARRFASRVAVNLVRGSRLISLKVADHDPEEAQRLTQAIIDEFFDQARSERRRNSATARELLLAEAKRVGDEFKASEEKLENYRNRYNAVSLQERQNIVVERLRELNQQVAAAENTRLTREAERAQVLRFAESAPDQLLTLRSIADSPEIVDMRRQISLQEAHVATLAQRYGPLHPTMIQARSHLDELQASLRGAIQKAGSRIVQSYESAKATESSLRAALAEQEKAALELDRIGIPYHSLERDVQANGGMYQKVLDELKQFDVTHGLTSTNEVDGVDIRIVEPPMVPRRPSGPHNTLLLAVSAATGLFVGCGLALGARALDTSVNSVDAAEAVLGAPVLATVPRSRHHRLDRRPVVARFPASAQAEAFRGLRTALSMLDGADDARRTVLFTSALPGEGKSFCSLNCAVAFAQQGLSTLLIDADFRRPGLRRVFSDPNERPQLTQCLRDPERFADAVQRTQIENLHVTGDWQHQAGSAELVAQDRMREILRRALERFERVVIDSAPLMAVSDTLCIARHVPTICLVVHAGRTPRQLARRALTLLHDVSKRRATGIVLNKIKGRAAGAHYYYYHAYQNA